MNILVIVVSSRLNRDRFRLLVLIIVSRSHSYFSRNLLIHIILAVEAHIWFRSIYIAAWVNSSWLMSSLYWFAAFLYLFKHTIRKFRITLYLLKYERKGLWFSLIGKKAGHALAQFRPLIRWCVCHGWRAVSLPKVISSWYCDILTSWRVS